MGNVEFLQGWAKTKLSKCCTLNQRVPLDDELEVAFIPMAELPTTFFGDTLFEKKLWMEVKRGYTQFQNNDVLLAKITPCFENGKATLINNLPNGYGAGSTEYFVLRALEGISPKFLYSIVKSFEFLTLGAANMSGSVGHRRVPKTFVENYPVLLPPLAEQQEIVRIIESHLQLVDQIKSRLDALPKILEQFRQSVLASAVSGKLTEEWRNSICEQVDVSFEIQLIKEDREKVFAVDAQIHKEKTGKNLRKYDYSTNQEPIPDREIPNTWVIAPLGELINFLTDYHANGSYEVLRDHVQLQSEESYACMIRSTNFEQNDFNDLIYISESAYHFLGKSKLYGNEILVSKIGNAGRVYLMPNLNKPVSLGMNLFALRFTEKLINPQYIYLFLISGLGTKNINKYVKGVATKSIDKKGLRSVFINLPPLEEQTEIVKRVDHLFALADQIEASIKHAQARVNLLTQSILAKAFRGEFTAKWREENPDLISGENSAEALLKRIEEVKKTTKKKK